MNNIELQLTHPREGERICHQSALDGDTKAKLAQLEGGRIDKIIVHYDHLLQNGKAKAITMEWTLNKRSPYFKDISENELQNFLCNVRYINGKSSLFNFEVDLYDEALEAKIDNMHTGAYHYVYGEALSTVQMPNIRSEAKQLLLPILDKWYRVQVDKCTDSIQFRICNNNNMYCGQYQTFLFNTSYIARGVPIFDSSGGRIVGIVGRRVAQNGNYSLLAAGNQHEVINIKSADPGTQITYATGAFWDTIHSNLLTTDRKVKTKEMRQMENGNRPLPPLPYPCRINFVQYEDHVIMTWNFLKDDTELCQIARKVYSENSGKNIYLMWKRFSKNHFEPHNVTYKMVSFNKTEEDKTMIIKKKKFKKFV